MKICKICGSKTKSEITIKEKRYALWPDDDLHVCLPCFDLWTRGHYDELDKKVLEKIKVIRNDKA